MNSGHYTHIHAHTDTHNKFIRHTIHKQVHTYVYIQTYTIKHTHTHMLIVYMYDCASCTHVQTFTHTHTHTHTNTHILRQPLANTYFYVPFMSA